MSAPIGAVGVRQPRPPQPPQRLNQWAGGFTRSTLTPEEALDLRTAARSSHYLISEWPRLRDMLDRTAAAVGFDPIGTTPVMSAPIVRLLCSIAAMHAAETPGTMVDRFDVSRRDLDNLITAAGGGTRGSLLDWPVLGGCLYRLADETATGGLPHAGDFHSTFAEGGAFRLLCRLLLEHVDVTD